MLSITVGMDQEHQKLRNKGGRGVRGGSSFCLVNGEFQ